MARKIFSKVVWVGRTAATLFGLALVMALVFGVATTAMGANGQNFILGSLNNAATAVTKLTGNVDGPAMQVVNNNADANDTALDLRVQAGEAPMRVNSNKKVANLNADKLDDREASSFANGVGGKATDADKLDGLDSANFAGATHDHAGEAITSGVVAEGRIDGSIARDSEVMPTVKANDGAGSGVDADTLDGNSSGSFASSTHNHDGRYYDSGSKVADSDKLDGKDSGAFGIRTEHNYATAHECDTPWHAGKGTNQCAPVTVTVPEGKRYVVSVWSSFSARHSEGFGAFQRVYYFSAGIGPGISTSNPCITPFGIGNYIELDERLSSASSSGETTPLSAGTYSSLRRSLPRIKSLDSTTMVQ